MMTEEEIEKIAKKVIEMQRTEGIKAVNGRCSIGDISKKYHKKLYDRFGPTANIETAIRTVAIYKVGVRYMAQIPEDKFQECRDYAEKLYQDILGE